MEKNYDQITRLKCSNTTNFKTMRKSNLTDKQVNGYTIVTTTDIVIGIILL